MPTTYSNHPHSRAQQRRARALARSRLALVVWFLAVACPCMTGCGNDSAGLGEQAGNDAIVAEPDGGIPSQDTVLTTNHPPVLQRIGDRDVVVGELFSLVLAAHDPDDDSLTYSAFGELPEGASFDKDSHTFAWIPKVGTQGQCVYVTFVVSDGQAFDRETARLCTVAERAEHPPRLLPVGDQYPIEERLFELGLEATDQDGDPLTFAALDLPVGAALDSATGRFRWTPGAGMAGTRFDVVFEVSDGGATDSQTVRFFVAAPGTDPTGPRFVSVPPQEATVGVPFVLELNATTAGEATLVFSMAGGAPEGASFDAATRLFRWTPPIEAARRTVDVSFEVTDGIHRDLLVVSISVRLAAVGECSGDAFEPNDTAALATDVEPGLYEGLSVCDEAVVEGGPDQDWFRVAARGGETVVLELRFEHAAGDLDAQLFVGDATTAAVVADSSSDGERLVYTASEDVALRLVVYGYASLAGEGTTAVAYSLSVTRSGAPACTDDDLEDNDEAGQAAWLSQGALAESREGLRICPGDPDWFALELAQGQVLELLVVFTHADGDLDAYLFAPSGAQVLVEAYSVSDDELIVFDPVPAPGAYRLLVEGYPADSVANDYALLAEVRGPVGCAPDAFEPNDEPGEAHPIEGDVELRDMTLCASADWFAVSLTTGDTLLAEARPGPGSLDLRLFGADGTTELVRTGAGEDARMLEHVAASTGTYFLEVTPAVVPVEYELDTVLLGEGGR